jgi:hypothetical protein
VKVIVIKSSGIREKREKKFSPSPKEKNGFNVKLQNVESQNDEKQ